jgi:hypothetical protein
VYSSDTNALLTALAPDGRAGWQQQVTLSVNYFAGVLKDVVILTAPMDNMVAAVKFSGTVLWTNRLPEGPLTGAIAPGGTIYIGSFGGKAFALRGDGSPARFELPVPEPGQRETAARLRVQSKRCGKDTL